jgi:hypothetical protein
MSAVAKAKPVVLMGHQRPRIAPPKPARSDIAGFRLEAQRMGITPMPWQDEAAWYIEATDADGLALYQNVAILVARQNGKTTMVKPFIVKWLREGKRVLHIAQTRELPRQMFDDLAGALSDEPDLFPKRRGRTIWPRYGAGQEEIKLENGGTYRIAANTRGGARGQSVDRLVVDETREMHDTDIIDAAEPTLAMSRDPQTVWLSNAGTDESVVLNGLRARGLSGEDPSLAYLQWSAAPDRDPGDREGWAEANPSLGHYPQLLKNLEKTYTSRQIEGTLATFETERLCRWVDSMREPLLPLEQWQACQVVALDAAPGRPYMAVSMDPNGKRASMAMAWRQADGSLALRMIIEATGSPINTDLLGKDMLAEVKRYKTAGVGYDPMTDTALTRFLPRTDSVTGTKYANASARFVTLVASGQLRALDCASVTSDLTWTTRKAHDEKGAFEAVRGKDDHPITASLAAIRAVWLASEPPRVAKARTPVGF